MLENIIETSILYDLYAELLPEKQRELFRLYHEDNYSLSEIGEEFGMTRQGVHEAVKRSEEKLTEFERKLGLAKKLHDTETVFETLESRIFKLLEEHAGNGALTEALQAMRAEIASLDR